MLKIIKHTQLEIKYTHAFTIFGKSYKIKKNFYLFIS